MAKGKKPKTTHQSSKKYGKYDLSDGLKRGRHCPRCGPGVFLGNHSNRLVCGKCGYVEMK